MKNKKVLPIVLSLLLLVGAGALVILLEPEEVQPIVKERVYQPVSVLTVQPQTFSAHITLTGTSHSRWPVELKAPASAKLMWLNELLEPGSLVKKGDVLAKLDTTHLSSRLALAHSALKQAELNLKREKHEQTVAIKMLSKSNSSAYARREPQIASAKAELQQAREAYISAKQHVDDATIIAPFNAVVLSRSVSPSQQLDAGQLLFELASSESLDVTVPVPEQQWEDLLSILDKPTIEVLDKQNNKYSAKVRYIAPEVDSSTRQRRVVLAVDKPYLQSPRLLPNQQLKVVVTLASRESVVRIPLSSLTRDGQVWTVDDEEKLRIEEVTVVEEKQGYAYVIFDNVLVSKRVVTYPLLSMIVGTQVKPEPVSDLSYLAGGSK
ncbi:efflux RND transporter periplasmic adaptor subunit [Vibrio sp. HN007]|uniref:efflux RND transporter periplasmic adaptor subunit n=1 Tax=Vibrio iocasae TaxID=3098914 RepID=UPI0035D50234